jgi:hypothetical protein
VPRKSAGTLRIDQEDRTPFELRHLRVNRSVSGSNVQ